MAGTSDTHTLRGPDPPWRTEAEIGIERQMYLAERLAIATDSKEGIYPFGGVKLNRADVEWLLAIHENGRGPIDESNKDQRTRLGLDLRGANLRQVNLCNLPLTHMCGGRNWLVHNPLIEEQCDAARVHLEGADLGGAYLEESFLGGAHLEEAFLGEAHLTGAYLEGAHLEGANLQEAHLEGADLGRAHLEGANLSKAHLEGANLHEAHLAGANLAETHLEGVNLGSAFLGGKPVCADYLKRIRHWDKDVLQPANLQGAFFDATTVLKNVVLGEEKFGFASLADLHWDGVNLSMVDWEAVTMLGDERRARQTGWVHNYQEAVRAYRQLSTLLQEQGLHEEARYFASRAQTLQRRVLWRKMLPLRRQGPKGLVRIVQKIGPYLLSCLRVLYAGAGKHTRVKASHPSEQRNSHPQHFLSIAQLIAQQCVDVETVALIWLMLEHGASLTVAGPTEPKSGAGKSTTIHALLPLLPEGTAIAYMSGMYETFAFTRLPDINPVTTYALCSEISDHQPTYMWGRIARRFLTLPAQGYHIVTSVHADTIDDVLHLYRHDLCLRTEDVCRLGLVVNIGLVGQTHPLRRRWLTTSFLQPQTDPQEVILPLLLSRWNESNATFEPADHSVLHQLADYAKLTPLDFTLALKQRVACLRELSLGQGADMVQVSEAISTFRKRSW